MWDWLTGNLRRRSRRRTERTSSSPPLTDSNQSYDDQPPTASGTGFSNFFRRTREGTQPFFVPTSLISESPPKCLSRLPCSQILYGERVEDFSSECWLENHLDQFGYPANDCNSNRQTVALPVFEEDTDDSLTSTTDTNSEYFDILDESDISSVQARPRLALEELFTPLNENETSVDGEFDLVDVEIIDPPPYTEYETPPPSYEEAVGAGRRSTSSRSTSSSLAFMW